MAVQKLIINSVTIIDDTNVKDINFKAPMGEDLEQTIFTQKNTEGGLNVTYTGETKKRYDVQFIYVTLAEFNTLLTYVNVPISYRVEMITDVLATPTDIFDGHAYLRIDKNSIEKIDQHRTFTLQVWQI